MLLLRDQGSRTNIGLCHVRLAVEIVDRYPCDHCCFCLIISLINFIPFGLQYLRNRFIKNAIRSNISINRFNVCCLSVSKFYLAFDRF